MWRYLHTLPWFIRLRVSNALRSFADRVEPEPWPSIRDDRLTDPDLVAYPGEAIPFTDLKVRRLWLDGLGVLQIAEKLKLTVPEVEEALTVFERNRRIGNKRKGCGCGCD